jgi:acyl-CoA synthetase (AMP-forming)/AMP-acid ligase II
MSASRPLDLPIERWTLVEALRLQAARLGEAEFLTFDAGAERLTFAELDRLSDQAAGALAALGVEPGDRVLALATNSKAFLVAMLGAHKRRAVFTPVNTELKGPFLAHQVRNSRPRVVVVDAELLPLFETVDLEDVSIAHTVVIGADAPPALPSPLAGSTPRAARARAAGWERRSRSAKDPRSAAAGRSAPPEKVRNSASPRRAACRRSASTSVQRSMGRSSGRGADMGTSRETADRVDPTSARHGP